MPYDLIEVGCPHPSLLQLLEWASRFDALMLPSVANQEHTIGGAKASQEIPHLVRTR